LLSCFVSCAVCHLMARQHMSACLVAFRTAPFLEPLFPSSYSLVLSFAHRPREFLVFCRVAFDNPSVSTLGNGRGDTSGSFSLLTSFGRLGRLPSATSLRLTGSLCAYVTLSIHGLGGTPSDPTCSVLFPPDAQLALSTICSSLCGFELCFPQVCSF
jgi:hypothetical protein